MSKNILYFIVALGVLLLVTGLIFFFSQQWRTERAVPSPIPVQTQQEQEGLGSQLYENPAERIPKANPLEGYKNPFE